jgi:hypothetical protein
MKVTAIEEAQDIASMKVEEVVGSLQTFEMNFSDKTEKKGKSIAFTSNIDNEEVDDDLDTKEDLSDDIVLVGRQFNKILKNVNIRARRNVKNIQFDISKQGTTSVKTKTDDKPNQSKGVQCHECEGYGHIRSECATYLKKQKTGLSVTWSDKDGSENELENEASNHVSAMTGVCVCDFDVESDLNTLSCILFFCNTGLFLFDLLFFLLSTGLGPELQDSVLHPLLELIFN